MIRISDIVETANEIRPIDPVHLEFLKKSIAKEGQKHPIPVMPLPGGKYKRLGGGHRSTAMVELGFTEFEAEIHDEPLDPDEQELQEVLDNRGHKEMTSHELGGVGFRRKTRTGCTNADLARDFALEPYQITRLLAPFEKGCPELLDLLAKANIQATAAVEIAVHPHDLQRSVLARIVRDGRVTLKREAIRKIIKQLLAESGPKRGRKPKSVEAVVEGVKTLLTIDTYDVMYERARNIPRAILWLKRNRLEPTAANFAEALRRVAARKRPKTA
jgi:ParB-like chromosome segregation protein Spo0J